MEVLVINHFFDRVEANLIKALAEKGVRFLCLTDPMSPFKEIVNVPGVELRDFQIRSRISLSAIKNLTAILNERSFDLIHCFSNRALATVNLTKATKGKPILCYRGTIGNISRFDPTSWLTYLHPRVTKISCVSKAVYQSLQRIRIPDHKLVQIYKGHDRKWYSAFPKNELAKFGIPEDAFVVCCTANVRRNKGCDILLEAARNFLKATLQARLLLVGEIRDKQFLRLLKNHPHKDRIHAIGFQADAFRLVGACDLFVMPSSANEGFPKAVLEAMCLGVACVVTDVGGLPEQVIHNHGGLVVPAKNATELARAVNKLIAEPQRRKAFGKLGQARVLSEFSFDRTIEAYWDVYQKLVK